MSVKCEVILVAGGVGVRMKSSLPKPLLILNGKPLITYSLAVFQASVDVAKIIVVIQESLIAKIERIKGEFGFDKIKCIVQGGKTRRESVNCGLRCLDADTKLVAIHDAARPLIREELVAKVIRQAKKKKAVTLGVAVKATIKQVKENGAVKKTLDRSELWEIQTPQVFARDLIVKAHQEIKADVTDDTSLVELLGKSVYVCEGSYQNLKVTTPEDLLVAQAFLTCEVRNGARVK